MPVTPKRMGHAVTDELRWLEELPPGESVRLLSTVSLGRMVFTARALPAIRPMNHVVDGDSIIVRTDLDASVAFELRSEPGAVVAYEADEIDPGTHLGWSVVVVGIARRIVDPDEAAVYRRTLRPWVTGDKDQVIAIHMDMVTGFRMVAEPGQHLSAARD